MALAPGELLHAPHLIDVEIAQTLRRFHLAGSLDAARAEMALDALVDLRLVRHGHAPLLRRVWQLRGNLSAYDAMYVALAEALGAPLLTMDRRLSSAPGHNVQVIVP